MNAQVGQPTRGSAGPMIAWSVWAGMTVAAVLFIRQYTRNMPICDDFELVPMMTGRQPVSLGWAWAQHNEHRPLISRLIQAGLSRFVSNDFRTAKYVNVGLLSCSAATMMILARRLRGSTRITDSVMPLSILNLAQAESLIIGFAMNLILTSWILCFLVVVVARGADRRGGARTALGFGIPLILLPLSGGSGLAMLPPLVVWMCGYVAWGWCSDREPARVARAIGIVALMVCSAVVALYLSGYVRPAYHPPAPSVSAAATTTLKCLSLAMLPGAGRYWPIAGLVMVSLIAGTLWLLSAAGLRAPDERRRATGLAAVILALIVMAAAVGVSRSGLHPLMGLSSRYVTIVAPLIGVLYIAWLVYGPPRVRKLIHAGLLAISCITLPTGTRAGLEYGHRARSAELRVEQAVKSRTLSPELMARLCPAIHPDPVGAYSCLEMLREARMGPFANLGDRLAVAPEASGVVR